MLDMLTAVDDPAGGRIQVVAHLVDVAGCARHLVWTDVDRDAPVLDSLVEVYPGAGWHEREVHEMFGVAFEGNPDLRPLLTTGDTHHPLRRTSPLPARLATPWPGAVDPSDRPAGDRVAARPRSRPGPPGVPPEWQA
jgi:NADH-quinone oxidoreductase subunit C